jgi:enhancing lycopene biosynthesis protein 2
MARQVAVVLSGCGVYDGAEIHEAVLTLLALDRRGVGTVVCAPDKPQLHVVDHRTGAVEPGAVRNVLAESARIARGRIRDLATLAAREFDGLVLPGGFGVAKNLCDFAVKGKDCTADPLVARFMRDMHAAGKPVAALCIAPALVARVLGDDHPALTIGDEEDTAAALVAMGARHVVCSVRDIVIDRERRIVTSPAYMLGQRISEVAEGIDRAMAAFVEMLG